MNLRKRKNITSQDALHSKEYKRDNSTNLKHRSKTSICFKKKVNITNKIDWNTMISASSVRNYMLDDPLIDWLKFYNIKTISCKPKKKTTNLSILNVISHGMSHNEDISHTNFIMSEGIKFEKQVIDQLKLKYPNDFIQVGESIDSRSGEKFQETLDYMKHGIDIIYQGVLHDYKNKLYGCPDLLVKTNRLNDIFECNLHLPIDLNDNHYSIVDIKHSTLHFACDNTHLLNSGNIAAYKGQILIYCKILDSIQTTNSYGYILGKNNIMATINYSNYDKNYIEKVDKAISWLHEMRNDGYKWHLLPRPSRNELYPNMKNDKDFQYSKLKNELSNKIGEITSIWNCGFNKRNIAHSKSIYSWKNKKANSSVFGFNKNKTSITIDKIVEINQSKRIKIRTEDLLQSSEKWRKFDDNIMEFYIDYETINNNIGQLSENNCGDYIFMIGIGWEENNKWMFKNFILDRLTKESELDMMKSFWDFINIKKTALGYTDTIFIHWTQAEKLFYNKFLYKHDNINDYNFPQMNFYDLYQLFLNNCIVVNGALDFKLKSIAGAMYRNKLIKSHWDNSNPCMNGLDAMLMAYNLYKRNDSVENDIMKNIAQYNEIDCKVMWEIFNVLRKV
jgi:hypothetical protein